MALTDNNYPVGTQQGSYYETGQEYNQDPQYYQQVYDRMTESANLPDWLVAPPAGSINTQAETTYTNPVTGETYTTSTGGYTIDPTLTPAPSPDLSDSALYGDRGDIENQQQLITGTAETPNEVNVMDYAGLMATSPVLQPEVQMGTQYVNQEVYASDLLQEGTGQVDTQSTASSTKAGDAATLENLPPPKKEWMLGAEEAGYTDLADATDALLQVIVGMKNVEPWMEPFLNANGVPDTSLVAAAVGERKDYLTAYQQWEENGAGTPYEQKDTVTVDTTETVGTPTDITAGSISRDELATSEGKVAGVEAGFAEGALSEGATITNVPQGELSEGALATGQTMDEARILQADEQANLAVTDEQIAEYVGNKYNSVTAQTALSDGVARVAAQQGQVQLNELPNAATIKEQDMAQAEYIAETEVDEEARVAAEQLEKFSVDEGTLASFVMGEVEARATVQGQLSELMRAFDNGTPAWAAGALRTANAAMAARGLSGSSMAGAAIVQAAMESAIPIAQQDAQTYADMQLSNLDRQHQVSLANAAAQQGVELANLDNRQTAALQNSAQAFELQATNLSNYQSVVIANAQLKASLQETNLSNQQQANLAVAARYAEMADLNLNNRQQAAMADQAAELEIELANLSNKQQSYITNATLEANLQGKKLDAEQMVAIEKAARYAEAANLSFDAQQQAVLHNSTLMQTIGLAELDAAQSAVLQNAANQANMDMANLDARMTAAVTNSKAFLEMDMANLSNEQQAIMFKQKALVDSIFNDQAAENERLALNLQSENDINKFNQELGVQVEKYNAEMKNTTAQINMAAENQANQFYSELGLDAAQFNTQEINDRAEFDAEQANATAQFNAKLEADRLQFNADNAMYIADSNVKWRREVNTANTAQANAALEFDITSALGLQKDSLDQLWDHYDSIITYAFEAAEGEAERATNLLVAGMTAEAQKQLAEATKDAGLWTSLGSAAGAILSSSSGQDLVSDLLGLGD